jgi:hypothetical protein
MMTVSTLELLLRRERDLDRVVLFPQARGSGAEDLARALVETIDDAHLRLLPAPGPDADLVTQRAWHRDAWLALPAADRDAVALVTGVTAGFLGPVLHDSARTIVLVRDPLSAVGRVGEPIPKRRALERLPETPPDKVPARMRLISNPQSRALLAPWHDPEALAVSLGPPGDAERWREALFGDVLPRVDVTAMEQAPRVVRELARGLGGRPKQAVQAAKAVANDAGGEDLDVADLLLGLNWLDAELYERCAS